MQPKPRHVSIDTARGVALAVMVFYHAWNWLVLPGARQQFFGSWDWWLCFLRLSAAPLFLLSFGCLLGILGGGKDTATLRARLWPRALQVFVVYKLLCFAELWARGLSWSAIHAALGYRDLSNWFQVLHFYALFLALSPWLLPWCLRRTGPARLVVLLTLGAATVWGQSGHWWSPVLQGVLVGREPYVNYPLVPWAIPALIGIWLGRDWKGRALPCLLWAALLGLCFLVLFSGERSRFDDFVIFSGGKNPPALSYVCIATATALCWLALCQRIPSRWAGPVQQLGRHPLTLYWSHVLFILFVFGMEHRHTTSDLQGWMLAALTLAFAWLVSRLAERGKAPVAP